MPAFNLTTLSTCPSTQQDAEQRAAADPTASPFAIRADAQTAGRGSRGRDWISETGNLHVSFGLRMDDRWSNPHLAPYCAALGVHDVISGLAPQLGPRLTLKWPNDVLIGDAKVSGTLITTVSAGAQRWMIIGIGINCTQSPTGTPYPATHLTKEGAPAPDLDRLANGLGEALWARLEGWLTTGFGPIREAYLKRAHSLGQRVRLRPRGESKTREGHFEGIADDGAFLLKVGDTVETHYAGDVFPGLSTN